VFAGWCLFLLPSRRPNRLRIGSDFQELKCVFFLQWVQILWITYLLTPWSRVLPEKLTSFRS
jgi:hypothetical protein